MSSPQRRFVRASRTSSNSSRGGGRRTAESGFATSLSHPFQQQHAAPIFARLGSSADDLQVSSAGDGALPLGGRDSSSLLGGSLPETSTMAKFGRSWDAPDLASTPLSSSLGAQNKRSFRQEERSAGMADNDDCDGSLAALLGGSLGFEAPKSTKVWVWLDAQSAAAAVAFESLREALLAVFGQFGEIVDFYLNVVNAFCYVQYAEGNLGHAAATGAVAAFQSPESAATVLLGLDVPILSVALASPSGMLRNNSAARSSKRTRVAENWGQQQQGESFAESAEGLGAFVTVADVSRLENWGEQVVVAESPPNLSAPQGY